MTKYIFVDLDECLFHSRYLGTDPTQAMRALKKEEKLIKLVHKFDGDVMEYEFYGSTLRPGAHDLLAKLRAIPNNQVMVLTSSVEDYAQANNRIHELGFDPNRIYAREELQENLIPDLGITDPLDAEFYLIDNLSRHENRIKVRWIEQLTDDAEVNYLKVPEFSDIALDRHWDAELIKDTVLRINGLDNFS